MPDENPSSSRMGGGDLNGKKSKLKDTGSSSNTSTPKQQKLDRGKKENLEHSAKSELKESPGNLLQCPKGKHLSRVRTEKKKWNSHRSCLHLI